MPIDLPRSREVALLELAGVLITSRRPGTDLRTIARDLLSGTHDVCARVGLDDIVDALPAYDDEPALTAITTRLKAIDLDGGGPRNAKPKQVVDCVIGALELNFIEPVDQGIDLDADVRIRVAGALTSIINAALTPPAIRDSIIADARALCDARFLPSFNKITAQLDERGQKLAKIPKVPIDELNGVQRALAAAREALIARTASTAIDRAKDVLAAANAEAGARIDQPITVRSTPREITLLRLTDYRLEKTPGPIAYAVLEGLSELARIRWRTAEVVGIPYGASKTFAINDVIDHPKFGRGTVTATAIDNQRIDVEFPDGKHVLIHVPPKK